MQALKNVMKKTADDFIYAGDEKDTGLAPVYSIETLANAVITMKTRFMSFPRYIKIYGKGGGYFCSEQAV